MTWLLERTIAVKISSEVRGDLGFSPWYLQVLGSCVLKIPFYFYLFIFFTFLLLPEELQNHSGAVAIFSLLPKHAVKIRLLTLSQLLKLLSLPMSQGQEIPGAWMIPSI